MATAKVSSKRNKLKLSSFYSFFSPQNSLLSSKSEMKSDKQKLPKKIIRTKPPAVCLFICLLELRVYYCCFKNRNFNEPFHPQLNLFTTRY